MAEKRRESTGTEGLAKHREKGASSAGGIARSAGARRTPLLDLNHCTARQLSLIQGVSREVGDRIVATRRRLGGAFQYFDQLHTIKGVTRAVIQALRVHVQVPGEEATPIGEPEGYMRLGPVQSQASLLSLNSLGDMARRKADKNATAEQRKSPRLAPPTKHGGKKRTSASTTPRKTVNVQRNVNKTPIRSAQNAQRKFTKTPAKSPKSQTRSSNRTANKSVGGKRLKTAKSPKATRKPGKVPVSSRRPPTGRPVKTKTPAKRSAKNTGTSASHSRPKTPRRKVVKSPARARSPKLPRMSPRGQKAVSVRPQAKGKKTSRRATPSRKPVTYKVVTSSRETTFTYPSRRRVSNSQPPVLVLKIETSPTQQTSTESAPVAVATSKIPQVEAEEISVSNDSRSRRGSKKATKKRTEEPSVEITPDSASATAGSKTPAVPSTTAGANVPTVEVGKDPAKQRSRASVEAVEKWLESTARYSTDLQQDPGEVDDERSSRHDQPGMEDITSEYQSAYAYPLSTSSAEQAKGPPVVQTESQGWNVQGNKTPPRMSSAQDPEGNDAQGNRKEGSAQPVAVEQVQVASAEAVVTPTGRERQRRRRHRHRRSRDEPSPKRRRRSVDSSSYPTCNLL